MLYFKKPILENLISLIQSRMEVLKKRLLKKNYLNWYEYDDTQIHNKCIQNCKEYENLNYALEDLIIENNPRG